MRKRFVLGLLVWAALAQETLAQPPPATWTRTYGGANFDMSYSVCQTFDGGYALVGYTMSFGAGAEEVYLIKTDSSGNQLWYRTYGDSSLNTGYDLQQTADSGFIICGFTGGLASSDDVYLIKTDAAGNPIWQRSFAGSGSERAQSVRQTTEGGYILAGYTTSYGSGNQVYLIKTDANGDTTWTRTFGGSDNDYGRSVQQTSDGGYIIAGYTTSFGSGYQVYLLKTDATGNLVWQHNFGGNYLDQGYSVSQTLDGGYIIAGESNSYTPNYGVYLIKTDAAGNLTWQHTYDNGYFCHGYSVQQTIDGGYVVAGYSNANIYLMKADVNGNLTWDESFGGTNTDQGFSVQQTTDGGYIIAGFTQSFGAGWTDAYLIKVAPDNQSFLDMTLTPINPPIVIPWGGGQFNFEAKVQRLQPPQTAFNVWSRDRFPDGTYSPILMGPVLINPPVGQQVTRLRVQNVPGTWPAGVHYYIGYANPTVAYLAVDADSFPWTKLTTGADSPWISDAVCTGEPFPGEKIPPLARGDRGDLVAISPNPFNPTTALSYELRAVSYVSLRVYDNAGRLVSTLADGMQETGQHHVTFDGSALASGMYFVRLQAGGFTQVRKMVLLK